MTTGSLPSWFIDEQMRGVLFAHTPYQLYQLRQPVIIDGEQMWYAFLIAGASSDWARRKTLDDKTAETEQWAVLRLVFHLSEREIARDWEAVGNGGGDVIEITFSSDLVTWRGHTLIAGADPNSPLLTGRAYSGSALYPMLYEDTAGMHVMFSSNANVDGAPRCLNGDGTPQSFGGLRTLEADVQTMKETKV
jgi:hypothetical protein